MLLEDDENLNRGIALKLQKEGYQVFSAFQISEAEKLFDENRIDLVISDITLPDGNGLEFCRKIRNKSKVFVLFLTAMDSEIDMVNGYDAGADDYITKPFGVMELVSRTKAVLRRTAKKVKTVLVYKNIEIDENKHTVLVDGAEIDLTYKEYEILKHLIRNKGIVLTRDRLMEIVWGYNFEQGNRTVDVHIQSLRKKLGTAGEHIKTIRNVGYKVGE